MYSKKNNKKVVTSSDLALDLILPDNNHKEDISVTRIIVDDILSKQIRKKKGTYITVELNDITKLGQHKKIVKSIVKELNSLVKIKSNDLILVIGLGNSSLTSDSLGPKVSDKILVTNHLYELDSLDSKYRRVCSIKPNVMGETGIETFNIVKGIVRIIKPNLIVVIDSLATTSINRLNKSIQLTNTGIYPGSGVGNNRKEISFSSLHIPVICIGVPTVINMSNIFDNKDYENMIVTPADIDYIVECFTNVIVNSLDSFFHNI